MKDIKNNCWCNRRNLQVFSDNEGNNLLVDLLPLYNFFNWLSLLSNQLIHIFSTKKVFFSLIIMQLINQEQDQLTLDTIMERYLNSLSSNHGVNNNDVGEALKLVKIRLGNTKDTLTKIHLKVGDTYTAEEEGY